jgi:hypothetical protein
MQPQAQYNNLPAFDEPIVQHTTTQQAVPAPTTQTAWYVPFYDTWIVFFMIGMSITGAFLLLILYSVIRVLQIRAHEKHEWDHEPPGLAASMFLDDDPHHAEKHVDATPQQSRWDNVLAHVRSENENDRRHAIIEADIMLGALLTDRGYEGETISDQLKRVDAAQFNTVELAWEAHKIRNKYAHEGSDIPCSAQEARRVVGLYEQVFREFGYIGQ